MFSSNFWIGWLAGCPACQIDSSSKDQLMMIERSGTFLLPQQHHGWNSWRCFGARGCSPGCQIPHYRQMDNSMDGGNPALFPLKTIDRLELPSSPPQITDWEESFNFPNRVVPLSSFSRQSHHIPGLIKDGSRWYCGLDRSSSSWILTGSSSLENSSFFLLFNHPGGK